VIALHLVGRKFAFDIGLVKSDEMSVEDLAKASGLAYKTVTARASSLRKMGWAESTSRGQYRAVYMTIDSLLSELEARTKGGD
jgi:DNA-binding transcriptional ArsR family regulator